MNRLLLRINAGVNIDGDCSLLDARPFDPIFHKRRYVIAEHSTAGTEDALRQYNMTFAQYLTATAGRRFDPPIEFDFVARKHMQDIFDGIDGGEFDFVFANPGTYSCVGVETGAEPLATVIRRVHTRNRYYDLDVYGGLVITRADRQDLTSLSDLRDRRIAAGDISSVMGGQAQIYEMTKAGLNHFLDPKQMVFTHNQFDVVLGVLNGTFDAGMVRTGLVEETKDENDRYVDADLIKVLEHKFHELPNGDLFPFLHTTEIFPEWPVAALRHVHYSVSKEVADALIALQEHAEAHEIIQNAQDPPRCDSTPEIAELAYEATMAGGLAGFRTPAS